MVKEFCLSVEGEEATVVVSDEETVLQAAKAAGRAVLGVWDCAHPEQAPYGVPYLVDAELVIAAEKVCGREAKEGVSDMNEIREAEEASRGRELQTLLERVVRRHRGLPWILAETDRLILREMVEDDWGILEEELRKTSQPFPDREAFLAYIRHQYPFYEYGLWALVKKASQVIPAAGLDNETGYDKTSDSKTGKNNAGYDKNSDNKTGGSFGDVIIGAAGFWDYQPEKETEAKALAEQGEDAPALEIGYLILPQFRRQGYGLEAVREVLRLAREQAGEQEASGQASFPKLPGSPGLQSHSLPRIYAKIREDNFASRTLIEQAGMKLYSSFPYASEQSILPERAAVAEAPAIAPDTHTQTRPARYLYADCC